MQFAGIFTVDVIVAVAAVDIRVTTIFIDDRVVARAAVNIRIPAEIFDGIIAVVAVEQSVVAGIEDRIGFARAAHYTAVRKIVDG